MLQIPLASQCQCTRTGMGKPGLKYPHSHEAQETGPIWPCYCNNQANHEISGLRMGGGGNSKKMMVPASLPNTPAVENKCSALHACSQRVLYLIPFKTSNASLIFAWAWGSMLHCSIFENFIAKHILKMVKILKTQVCERISCLVKKHMLSSLPIPFISINHMQTLFIAVG